MLTKLINLILFITKGHGTGPPRPLRFGGILWCYPRGALGSLFGEMQLTQRCAAPKMTRLRQGYGVASKCFAGLNRYADESFNRTRVTIHGAH